MKVWVVVVNYKYDGYGPPEAVFSSKEAAQEYAKTIKVDPAEVLEYTLDEE